MKKEILFRIIAISLPFFLVFILEIALRVSGYGKDYTLFHQVITESNPRSEYLVMQPQVSRRYFRDKAFHADNQADPFLKTKTDSTFRIMVQGASTVVGFPYYGGGSFPRMLKHRLSQTFPTKNIEVINTGITAVNSYTLWDLTDEIIAEKPDLIIIYAGHNEYYGALGVGSSSFLGSHPDLIRTYLALRSFHFLKLLGNGYAKLLSLGKKTPKIGQTTLMEVMAREQRIPLNSDIYYAGVKQYESNLEKILSKYKAHDIPVILSTLVCNEKDIKPFISDDIQNKNQFAEALNQKKPQDNHLVQENANAAYAMGQHYLHENRDTAQKYLHIAKELDLLRFRAPEKINDLILSLAKKYNYPLVDMKEVFISHSPEGIIGNELLLEHVHPNIKGYFIMADAFYEKIKELSILNDWGNYISYEEAFRDIPITEIDSFKATYVIDDLKQSWPYDLSMSGARPLSAYYSVRNPSYEQSKALNLYMNKVPWNEVMEESLQWYERSEAYEKGLRVAQSLILEYPEVMKNYNVAGKMCLGMGYPDEAAYYFYKYNQLGKQNSSAQ